MKRIASLITAVIIMLNISLAYISTVKTSEYGIKVTSQEGSEVQIIPTSNKIKGWQVESGNTTVTNNKFTMPGEDTTIVAVTLATNTLTVEMPDFTRTETKEEGESVAIETTEIEGKEFTSWIATGITLTEGQTTSSSITIIMPGNAVTLVANYKNKTYTITYDANGGSGAPENQTKIHGEAIALSETTPTREGYTFKGWATSNTATTAEYEAGSEYTTNANLSLYAVWQQEITAIIANENVALGTYITYVPSKTTSTVLRTDSGYTSDQTFNPSETTSWRVLNNNNGQLEIISTESIGNLTLKGVAGYTRAVYTLNKLCKDYINPTYADDARNPGYVKGNRTEQTVNTERVSNSSLPIIDTDIYPLSDRVHSNYTNEDEGEDDTQFPYADTLYNVDITQIGVAGVLHSSGNVWLASRYLRGVTETSSSNSFFSVRVLDSDGNCVLSEAYYHYLVNAYASTFTTSSSYTYGVRPIVNLKSRIKITGGEGTSTSPYTIGID